MSLISDLWKLQEIDLALDARRGSLEDAEARLGESEELLAARDRTRELQEAARRARTEQKDIELEADELRSKIAPLETKLYGGSIRNPKELKDLQADIDQLRRHLSAVEDRDLEALTLLETADSDLRMATADLEALEAAAIAEQRELHERIERLRGEIEEYASQRDEQAAHIDRATLKTYDHLRQAHQGRALAKLDRNLCLGCRISLPTSVVNKARAGNTLAHCPNCERILVA
jgi:predicted  nucleic acid-binding Zn-ribbon protein